MRIFVQNNFDENEIFYLMKTSEVMKTCNMSEDNEIINFSSEKEVIKSIKERFKELSETHNMNANGNIIDEHSTDKWMFIWDQYPKYATIVCYNGDLLDWDKVIYKEFIYKENSFIKNLHEYIKHNYIKRNKDSKRLELEFVDKEDNDHEW